MITNNESTKELMINTYTGKLFTRDLTIHEQAEIIIRSTFSDEMKIEKMQALGLSLDDIVDLAFFVADQDSI